MKNATKYEEKVRKLLSSAKGSDKGPSETEQPLRMMVRSILHADATAEQTDEAMEKLDATFVDINELRVTPAKEIVEAVGKDFPRARDKALRIRQVLGGVYDRRNDLNIEYMAEMPKRELRRHLDELGMDTYSAALLVLTGFAGHAVPVDDSLRDALEMEEMIYPESEKDDVQGFLERIVSQKNALSAHEAFRDFVRGHAKELDALNRQRQEQRRKEREEELARQQKKEQQRLEAEAKKKARQQAEAEKKARKAAKSAAKTSKTEAGEKGRKTAGKAAPKKASPRPKKKAASSKKTARKKKSASRSAGKRTSKSSRKTSKKAAGRKASKKSRQSEASKKAGKDSKSRKKASKKTTKKTAKKRAKKK